MSLPPPSEAGGALSDSGAEVAAGWAASEQERSSTLCLLSLTDYGALLCGWPGQRRRLQSDQPLCDPEFCGRLGLWVRPDRHQQCGHHNLALSVWPRYGAAPSSGPYGAWHHVTWPLPLTLYQVPVHILRAGAVAGPALGPSLRPTLGACTGPMLGPTMGPVLGLRYTVLLCFTTEFSCASNP